MDFHLRHQKAPQKCDIPVFQYQNPPFLYKKKVSSWLIWLNYLVNYFSGSHKAGFLHSLEHWKSFQSCFWSNCTLPIYGNLSWRFLKNYSHVIMLEFWWKISSRLHLRGEKMMMRYLRIMVYKKQIFLFAFQYTFYFKNLFQKAER